ncbi:hypothetical protein SLEP1_g15009 [Rubroshorea leprosula]|uniref:Uncharacterized protein n=1 Tax=Rubroshorea leprosula TaxID=152421 RepID=A0AAV5IXM5_9ROSI|nr:hypothetical protein SLEP1_g15009 [Rubroshorea leprosula]
MLNLECSKHLLPPFSATHAVTPHNPNPRRDRRGALMRRVPQMHKARNLLNKISFDTIKFPIKI